MSLHIAMDPRPLIWHDADFENRNDHYMTIAAQLVQILKVIAEQRTNLLIRNELVEEAIRGFPLNQSTLVTSPLQLFSSLVIRFFVNHAEQIRSFAASRSGVRSRPYLHHHSYSALLRSEIESLLGELYSRVHDNVLFVSVEALWETLADLELTLNGVIETLPTRFRTNDLSQFMMREFEPSPKHDVLFGWDSKLTVSEPRARELVRTSIKVHSGESQALFNYIPEVHRFVIFRITSTTLYHAYEVDDPNEVPTHVRKQLIKMYPTMPHKKKILQGRGM